ncbi:MAG: dual specificity protein phosphatase family protein [Anaerolineales bacterium]
MTIDPLSPHPKWLRRTPLAVFWWFVSRTNDNFLKSVLVPFVRITPNLMIGPQLNQRGWRLLQKRYGANAIINMRVEADDRERGIHPEHYLWLPTIDHTSPTVEQLQDAAAFLAQRIHNGDVVYVHCAAGVGRAPMAAAAYLITQGYTVDEARELIKSRRPFINQSANQRSRLQQFAALMDPIFPQAENQDDDA